MANALARESSPYLRQHGSNPVDWLPWGEEALARARELDRPLLVSIGYSACHWCHVMERESFEDARTAALMNESFVPVKVDREERPDLDAIYMEAVQGMTGHGGWPLNVFLTPEQLPFYGGTYFPPEPREGMPSFSQVLQAVAEAWEQRGDEIRASSERLRARLAGGALLSPSREPLQRRALEDALSGLETTFDERHGGFGGAPKFPQAPVLDFLMALAADRAPGAERAEHMALATLQAMARGGLLDVVGGGFHRYTVDAAWTVPHFEKMLYDNALLARAYLHGYQLGGDERLLDVCLQTLGWALREMRGPEGGFYSALDADAEGVEGSFYVWTARELHDALGAEDAATATAWLGVSERGNFSDPHHPRPGLNVLTDRGPQPERATRERILARLREVRSGRPRPALDTKRLTSWNALMICALAETGAHLLSVHDGVTEGSAALDGDRLLGAARQCAEFVLGTLRDEHGRLLRSFNDGQARLDGYLEDYAFLLEALLALYEASFEERWFIEARSLADQMIARFGDPIDGGFYSTASDHEQLIARRKELEDSPIPAGASSAALGLLRLAALSGEYEYERQAVSVLRLVGEIAPRHPGAFGHLLLALHVHLAPMREVAIVGAPALAQPLLRVVRERYRPSTALAFGEGDGDGREPVGRAGDGREPAVGLLVGRTAIGGRATAYVCQRQSCQEPVSDPAQLAAQLER